MTNVREPGGNLRNRLATLLIAEPDAEVVIGRNPKDTRKRLLGRYDGAMRHADFQHSPLTPNLQAFSRRTVQRTYRCTCLCGSQVYFRAQDALFLLDKGWGCMSGGCAWSPSNEVLWTDWKWALWVQLSQALALYPERVKAELGGLFQQDQLEGITREGHVAGFKLLLSKTFGSADLTQQAWWLDVGDQGRNPPVMDMDHMRANPHPSLFPKGEISIVQYGATDGSHAITLREAAEQFGIDYTAACVLHRTLVNDETLIDLFAEENTMVNDEQDKHNKGGQSDAPQVYKEGQNGFNDLLGLVERSESYKVPGSRRYNYNVLVEPYNEADVDSILVMTNSAHLKHGNVVSILVNRGLTHNIDFTLHKPFRREDGTPIPKEERHLLLTKLTVSVMQLA
jgi:hypothetical protein